MVHPRIAGAPLRSLLRRVPVLTILGPRQIGKSTLARWAFPRYEYLDLEDPDDYDRLADDPRFVLSRSRHLILDEAQRLPELFPLLRSFLDEHPRHRVVLLGSASPGLLTRISESLAGRTLFFELSGLSILEHDAEALWIRGGYPRVHWSRPRAKPEHWYPSYLRTCLEKDVPELGFRLSSVRLRRLLTMLAHAQGGITSLSELGGSLGITYHSVAHLIDVLDGVFLVRRLQPYFANIGKRLVKSPKLYVRDTGVLHSLLGIPFTKAGLLAHPKAGASFETFCLDQVLQHARLADPACEAFFFRTYTGVEVDLLLRLRGEIIPIEFKLGLGTRDTGGLVRCVSDLGLERGYLVNLSSERVEVRPRIWACGLRHLLDDLDLVPKGPARDRLTAPAGRRSTRRRRPGRRGAGDRR